MSFPSSPYDQENNIELLEALEAYMGVTISTAVLGFLWSPLYAPNEYCQWTFLLLNVLVLLFLLTFCLRISTAATLILGYLDFLRNSDLTVRMNFKTVVVGLLFLLLFSYLFRPTRPEDMICFILFLGLNSIYVSIAYVIYLANEIKYSNVVSI